MPHSLVDTKYPTSDEALRLCRELNEPLADVLPVRLWCWGIETDRESGRFVADAKQLAQIVRFHGDPEQLLRAFLSCDVIEKTENTDEYRIKGWKLNAKFFKERRRLRKYNATRGARVDHARKPRKPRVNHEDPSSSSSSSSSPRKKYEEETDLCTDSAKAETETGLVLTAPPSAPAVRKTRKRSPEQAARSLAVNRRYRERYEDREGHPPTGMDAAFNGMLAKFADKHADNALAILDWFFESPDPRFKNGGWKLEALLAEAPRLWREVNNKRKAIESMAAPAQIRQQAVAAGNELAFDEFVRRREVAHA